MNVRSRMVIETSIDFEELMVRPVQELAQVLQSINGATITVMIKHPPREQTKQKGLRELLEESVRKGEICL